jgi:hypothetical protein
VLKDNGARLYCMKSETRLEGPIERGEYAAKKKAKTYEVSEMLKMTKDE